MTDPARSLRWQAALARARKRWDRGGPAERVRVEDELDALWAELGGEGPPSDAAPVTVGPRRGNLHALLRYQ